MIQKLIEVSKNEQQDTLRLHHQPNVTTTMPFSYIKCSLISMFILVKDESENLILAF